MIHLTDERLKEWVGTVVDGAAVSLAPPGAGRSGQGVGLYLMELVDAPRTQSTRLAQFQLGLRYLVTTWAEEPDEAHRMLGELVFAAMGSADFEVELAPPPPALWSAFGAVPQPCFVLRVPLRLERPEPDTKLVRMPMVVRYVTPSSLFGLLLGPGDVPLVGATVELPALRRRQRTDRRGQFAFKAVPDEGRARVLRVRAGGRELQVTVDQPTSETEPMVIHFNPVEER